MSDVDVTVRIDHLVVEGLSRSDSRRMSDALSRGLSDLLTEQVEKGGWGPSREITTMDVATLPVGESGPQALGTALAHAVFGSITP